MAGVNKVILIGNLGRDPEIRQLESGAKVATFSLATTETYKSKEGNKVEQTEWHNIVVWRGQAEIAEKYIKTGKQLYVEGKLRTNVYEDKDTGVKKYFTEVYCLNFRLLGSIGESGTSPQRVEHKQDGQSIANETEPSMPEPEDDLPF